VAVCHLRFLKVRNFNFLSGSEDQYASSCQMCRSVKQLPRIHDYWIFQDGGCRHVGFLKFNFFTVTNVKKVELHHFAKFSRNRSNWPRYGHFSISQDGGRRHFGFLKFLIFNSQEGRTASLCQILSILLELQLTYGNFSTFLLWRPPPF